MTHFGSMNQIAQPFIKFITKGKVSCMTCLTAANSSWSIHCTSSSSSEDVLGIMSMMVKKIHRCFSVDETVNKQSNQFVL